ncbi:MAG: metal ABC transporter solute-binding protein, Zn/Mn family [Gemmobacter sp.]
MNATPLRALLATLLLGAALPAAAAETRIVATVAMIGDLAREVAGDCAQVDVLMGPGIDPHLYAPRPSDLRLLRDADLVLHVGLGLEGRFGALLARMGPGALAVAEALPEGAVVTGPEGGLDPHLWMDPALWSGTLGPMSEAMAARVPACAAEMDARAETLAAELVALDGWVAASVATIPETARVLVTAHDAFGYFARRYGLKEAALQGFSTEAEASIADIAETASLVINRGVPAVFVETTVNPRAVAALSEAVAAQGGAVALGPELFSDAMGDPATPEGSYIGMIRHNARAIVTALGGTPAPWPEALAPWAVRQGIANGG